MIITTEQKEAWVTLEPVATHPQNEEAYDRLIESINELIDETGGDENHPMVSLLNTLGDIAMAYENDHHQINTESVTPSEMLAYLMEEKGMKQKDLVEAGFDAQGNISKILNGRREMSLNHVKKACEIFSVSAGVFI